MFALVAFIVEILSKAYLYRIDILMHITLIIMLFICILFRYRIFLIKYYVECIKLLNGGLFDMSILSRLNCGNISTIKEMNASITQVDG